MATKNVSEKTTVAVNPTKHYSSLEHYERMPPQEWNGAYCGAGPLLHFEATDAELIECNLIDACNLPSRARGWAKHFYDGKEYWQAKRLTDGRVSLCISSSLARKRDPRFMNLMAGLAMLVD